MKDNDFSRRHFINRIAKGLLGLSLVGRPAFAATPIHGKSTADHVIYLFMSGGMSHLDTFDLRPDNREIQGPVKGIKTKVPGIHVCENLPLLAAQMDRLSILSWELTVGN